jgi:hypothetical protein
MQSMKLEIFNVNGSPVTEKFISEINDNEVHLIFDQTLSSGIYILRISDRNRSGYQLFVVN